MHLKKRRLASIKHNEVRGRRIRLCMLLPLQQSIVVLDRANYQTGEVQQAKGNGQTTAFRG